MAPRIPLSLTLAAALAVLAAAADAPKPAADGPLVVIDSAGKEQKLKTWKFTAGVRRLSWLAPAAPPAEEGKASKGRARPAETGPEALEFREENSTPFVEGVMTFVPLDRIRSLDYDPEEKKVTAHVASGPKQGDDAVLTGTTRFERVNKLVIEAEVDKGDLGIAEVRFLGGTARGIRGLRFPAAKPAGTLTGRPAVVTTAGKEPSTHKVVDLQALYRFATGYRKVAPLLMFKKTLKLDVAKIQKITAASPEDEEGSWQVQMKDGGDEALSLLRVIPLDGQDAQLEGLLGRVPAGYKLFPILTVAEVQFDAAEPKSEPKSEPASEPKSEPEPKLKPKPKPKSKSEPKPQPEG
jgi:hypothetical protein